MKSIEINKKNFLEDPDSKLILLLKTYFKNLSDAELTHICEDIVIKYNENKQLEKLKNLKKLIIYKKKDEKKQLIQKFRDWKNKINLLRLGKKHSIDYNSSIKNEDYLVNQEKLNFDKKSESKIDNSFLENRYYKKSMIYFNVKNL